MRNSLADKSLILLFATTLSASAAQTGGWTAICGEPRGAGFEYGDLQSMSGETILSPSEGFKVTEDSFTNVHPAIYYPGDGAQQVTVVWGNTRPKDIPSEYFRTPKARQDIILSAALDRVSTVAVYPSGTWMNTYYPYAGIVFATRHDTFKMQTIGYSGDAITYTLKCTFTPVAE